jgi:AcrR family transcriptional regulator
MAVSNTPEADMPVMRRAPQQARGQQRVAAILDAAEQLFAETGYEAATTNQLAARAGVPIGSIYQFFPNKEAILHAAAARYREGFAEQYERLLADGLAALPLPQLVTRLLDTIIAYGGAHIGVTRIALVGAANPHTAAVGAALQDDLLQRLDALLATRAPHLAAERRQFVGRTALVAVFALLAHGMSYKYSAPEEMFRVFEEVKTLLLAYLRAATEPG